MKNKKIILFLTIMIVMCMVFLSCGNQEQQNTQTEKLAINFVDDEGREINLEQPCEKIISLYSAHTENLYSLGAGDKLIGNYKTGTYPAEAAKLEMYDYNSDPEKIIAAAPDLVLIRPFITRKAPEFVDSLEKAGVLVVSLYPETYDDFEEYITRLSMLVGAEDVAKQELEKMEERIAGISESVATASEKQTIFFESTEVNLRTVTPDSMPGKAIVAAGGESIAQNAEAMEEGSSIATFGEEAILAAAEKIDVYVSQRGAMNSGGSIESINERPGFETIKAVKEGRVYVINEKIISSPTFRYYKGIKELARYMYPEIMDDLSAFENDEIATRRDFANIIVRERNIPIWIPSSSKYYESEHDGHTFGMFSDVTWQDEDFDYIETAVMSGAINEVKIDGVEYFYPENTVTRQELANAAIVLGEFENVDTHKTIKDLDECKNQRVIQMLVDNGVFELKNGKFQPEREVTCSEIIEVIKKTL